MNKVIKYILIIAAILIVFIVIAAGIIGYVTYTQIKPLIALSQDNSIKSDFEKLLSGNCSVFSSFEAKINDVETKLKVACSNPLAKFIIIKVSGQDICLQLDSYSQTKQSIEQVRQFCAGKISP